MNKTISNKKPELTIRLLQLSDVSNHYAYMHRIVPKWVDNKKSLPRGSVIVTVAGSKPHVQSKEYHFYDVQVEGCKKRSLNTIDGRSKSMLIIEKSTGTVYMMVGGWFYYNMHEHVTNGAKNYTEILEIFALERGQVKENGSIAIDGYNTITYGF